MHYSLGRTSLFLNDYDDGIANLRIAKALEFRPFLTRLYLGEALRGAKVYDGAWAELKKLATDIQAAPLATLSEPLLDVNYSVAEMRVRVYTSLSLVCSDRGGGDREAYEHVLRARDEIGQLPADCRDVGLALCSKCDAWIFLVGHNDVDSAIRELRKSADMAADVEVYWQLAVCYSRKLARAQNAADKAELEFFVRQWCQQVRDQDTGEAFAGQVEQLLKKVATPVSAGKEANA